MEDASFYCPFGDRLVFPSINVLLVNYQNLAVYFQFTLPNANAHLREQLSQTQLALTEARKLTEAQEELREAKALVAWVLVRWLDPPVLRMAVGFAGQGLFRLPWTWKAGSRISDVFVYLFDQRKISIPPQGFFSCYRSPTRMHNWGKILLKNYSWKRSTTNTKKTISWR